MMWNIELDWVLAMFGGMGLAMLIWLWWVL